MTETTTARVDLAQAHDASRDGLSVHCPDGATWAGTFGVVVVTLLRDILNDGEPVTAVVYTGSLTDGQVWRHEGIVTAVTAVHPGGRRIEFADGAGVAVDEVVSVFV